MKVMQPQNEQILDQWESIKKNFQTSITKMFPITGKKNVLEIGNLSFDESKAHPSDIKSQELHKHAEKTWGIPVYADFILKDKNTGQVIDKSKQKIAVMPRLTQRETYIVSGGEYNSAYQWRLKSGIYSQIKENGKYETVFNLNGAGKDFAREQRLKIPFDDQSRVFKFKYGTVAAPLYSILKASGVSDEAMKSAWGEDIYKANCKKNWEQDVLKLYNSKLKKRGLNPASDNIADVNEAIKRELNKAEVLPETTKLTLGKEYKELSGQALLDGSVHIMKVAKGEKKPDDVYSLYFKHLLGLDDFIGEKFGDSKTAQKIKFKIKNNIDRKESINQVIPSDLFSKPLGQVFYGNSLSQRPDQTNPLDMLSSANLTTIKGPGGISSEHAIRNSMKIVSQSHLAMLDPLLTPEGTETGISLHLPIGVRKIGREARTFVYNIPEAKFQYINPAQLHGDLTVLPDQIKWKEGKPVPHKDTVTMMDPKTHEFIEKPFSEAKYVLPSAKHLFSEATNLIPFLQCNQGNRTMTGSRQPSQGVSLLHREAPLVQVQSNNSKVSFEDIYGKQFSHQSPVDGKIVDIEKDHLGNADAIHIKSGDKTFRAQIYNHFPLNDKKAFLHAEPTVKIGDEVKKGQQIADSNFSKNGTLAIGTNLRVGYFPYSSLTYEDSVVISENAAKKLASEHLHKTSIDIDPKNDKVSLNKFLSHISSAGKKLKKDKVESIGEDGIIKPGSIVKPGDLLVTAVSKNSLDPSLSMLSSRMKGAITPYKDKSLVWDHDYEGKVIKVIPKPGNKGYTVYVKTVEPAQVGDKVCGRAGDKNIIGAILPMEHTPYVINEKGEKEHLDLITAPSGVVSRINVGQLMEMAASKIALKTGKPYVTNNFAGPNTDYAEKIRRELKEHNIKDQEVVYDPVLGKNLDNPVLVGHKYIMKLKHQVEKKESVRGLDQAVGGKYTINLDPQRGKGEGAQAIAQLDLYALLAHGARENLKEMSSYKAELQHDPKTMSHTDDDFWNRVMVGMPLPTPKPTFAYRKFEGYLTGLGLNLQKNGHETVLTPLTDKGTLAQSNGEIKDAQQVRGKDDKEIPGGLFDVKTTGGIPNGPRKGLFWTHYTLAEPYPNPLFVGAKKLPGPAVVLSGLNYGDFSKVVTGEKTVEVGGKQLTGGKAIEALLKKVDVKKELQSTIESLPSLKGAQRNQANKKAKFLQALDKLKMRPEDAYIMNHIPILPPIFRPLVQTPSGEVANADITELYKHLIINSNQLKDKEIANIPEEAGKLRAAVWDNLKAITGLGKVPTYDGNRKYKGILQNIAGDSPKTGFFQHKVMKRRQELSMRSTIIPGVDMGIDEVGIPRGAAMELYKPFIVRELVRSGKDLIEAKREVKEGTPLASKALDNAVRTRPVLIKRDPVLHRYNIQAFRPKLIEGKAIALHPLNCAAFNADNDGDTMAVYLPLTETARQEALDKMLPSKNLFSSTNYGIMHAPDHEAIIGLNMLSSWGTNKPSKQFNSLEQIRADKSLSINEVVKLKDKETTKGRALLAEHLPVDMDHTKLLHDPSLNLKKGNIHSLLEGYARKDPQGYPILVDDWRRKGSDVAHSAGFSFSMNDLKPMKEKREAILAPYHEEAKKIWNSKLPEEEKENKVVELYNNATTHLVKDLSKEYTDNNIFKMVDTKARGKIEQFRQTVIAPMLLVDSTNRTIPTPVTKSYSEGLNVSQYWTTLHGARKGTLQRAQGTSVPGALAKEIVNLNVSTPIVKHDCGVEHGLHMDLQDKNGKDEVDVMDRYLAKDTNNIKKGTLITPEIFSQFKKDGIKSIEVRSPITCKVPQGICSKCFGLNADGHDHEVGTNIGVIASQSISEPVVQLAMDTVSGKSIVKIESNGKIYDISFEHLWETV